MIIKGVETLLGKKLKTLEEFTEDLCDRINNIYNLTMEEVWGDEVLNERNVEIQLGFILGALSGLRNRLNRVCERP
ncbi:MAG: hypothetical protein ACFE9T_15295 [Promethearchaeota archaeon]